MFVNEEDDDQVFEMPHWPAVKYSSQQPDMELRIPDYLWFDSEEMNHALVLGLRYLAEHDNMLELGRNREFEYNYVRFTEQAAMMLCLHYPELKNWIEPLPRLK